MPGISKSARRRRKAVRIKTQKRTRRYKARKAARNAEATVIKILKKGLDGVWLVASPFSWFFDNLKTDAGNYPGTENVQILVDKINFAAMNGHPLHLEDTMFIEAEVTDIGEIWAKIVKVKGGERWDGRQAKGR